MEKHEKITRKQREKSENLWAAEKHWEDSAPKKYRYFPTKERGTQGEKGKEAYLNNLNIK